MTNDPLFLQFKEAQASVLEPFLGKSQYTQHGQRVVEGQRMMQAAPDILLGWERIVTIDGGRRDFYIRQLWDAEGLGGRRTDGPARAGGLRQRSAAGRSREPTRARATGSRSPPISAAATPSTAPWPRFPRAYADQNDRDYRAPQKAAASGRIVAEHGRLITRRLVRRHRMPRPWAARLFRLPPSAAGKRRRRESNPRPSSYRLNLLQA